MIDADNNIETDANFVSCSDVLALASRAERSGQRGLAATLFAVAGRMERVTGRGDVARGGVEEKSRWNQYEAVGISRQNLLSRKEVM